MGVYRQWRHGVICIIGKVNYTETTPCFHVLNTLYNTNCLARHSFYLYIFIISLVSFYEYLGFYEKLKQHTIITDKTLGNVNIKNDWFPILI